MSDSTEQVVITGKDGLPEEHLQRVLTPLRNSRRFVAMDIAAKSLDGDTTELDRELEELAKACFR
jgi:hypothetical protein